MAAQPVNLLHTVIAYAFRVVTYQEHFWHSRALNDNRNMKLNLTYLFTM